MKASGLFPNFEYVTEDGTIITVVNPTPVRDGFPEQRKVLVEDVSTGVRFYILPRLINGPNTNTINAVSPVISPRKVISKKIRRAPAPEVIEAIVEHDAQEEAEVILAEVSPVLARYEEPVVRHSLTVMQEESIPLDISDPRLDALRPDPALLTEYVSRKMPNGATDLDYLMKRWEKRENVLLVGDTQGGKTMLVNVMAILIGKAMGLDKPVPVFTLSASNGITDFDLFGQPTAWTDPETGQERLVWLPGTVDMAARVGGILYLDEVNMMPERVTSSLHPVCDWRRAFTNRAKAVKVPNDGFMPEIVHVTDKLWIIGTMNPGYRGAGSLNEAFANRFRHLEWAYDASVEKRLIPNDAIRTLGDALRSARATGHIRTPIGTAALMRFNTDVEEDGIEMAMFTMLSMFTADEKPVIEEIVESRSFKTLIANEASGKNPLTPGDDSPFGAEDQV